MTRHWHHTSPRKNRTHNIQLARLSAGVQKASLDVHNISAANGSAVVSGTKCLQPTHIAVELSNGYHGCSDRTVSLLFVVLGVRQWGS